MDNSLDTIVCIGRFQLPHNAHLALLRQALASGKRCVVILGSAHQARSPRNPFTWQERAEMLGLVLTPEELSRVSFEPVRDYYDIERWSAAVRAAVARHAAPGSRVGLLGHRKDATSDYLGGFPGWTLVEVGSAGPVNARDLRAALFSADHADAALAAIAGFVHPFTIDFLRAWVRLPAFQRLRTDWREVQTEITRWDGSPYPPTFITVDAVLRVSDHVLLIRRGRAPGRGLLALPGGFLDPRETVYQSAVRELKEETHVGMLDSTLREHLAGVRVFDHPDRSERGRVVTHAHYFKFGAGPLPEIRASDDAAEAMWVPVTDLANLEGEMHDDHFHILDSFLQVL